MAASFSSTAHSIPVLQIRPNYSNSLLFLPAISTSARVIVCSLKTDKLQLVAGVNLSGGPIVKRSLQKRLVIRSATIEEIEAEKSAIENDAKSKMEKTIETLRTSFNSIRTGRANVSMLDKIEVEYYGSPVSLKSIAQISTPDGTSLLLQPYDKSSLKAIEKAIVSSDLGMTPNNDGDVIRLSLPPLTSERRKELSKVVAKQSEEGKVALRNIRRDALKSYDKLEKEKKLSEDNVNDMSSDLQKLIDIYMKKIEELYKQKEKLKDGISMKTKETAAAMEKPKALEKPTGNKQTATVVIGALAVAWLAIEIVFKPLFNKLSSSKDKSDSDEAAAPSTTAPPESDA